MTFSLKNHSHSALAMEQKKEIEKLVAQQAKEREQLRSLFENQQRQLIACVVSAVSSTSDQGTVFPRIVSAESILF